MQFTDIESGPGEKIISSSLIVQKNCYVPYFIRMQHRIIISSSLIVQKNCYVPYFIRMQHRIKKILFS